ncbi:uncharacterized protein LOC111267550 [Varroa jacobsoni]|uniref:uncharacterized protein LOC111267550 n=1 Tax=Varroa jacobsoni TaxID=62625 RepID=UPI000BF54074|nr:uncharacterized protein LOC111267550 [Varroa jacobsoni]
MSVIRGRVAERCTSPNEHVELIRELESRYAEMLKPIRDLNKNFAVSLDVLEKYIQEVKQISIDTINFANAGLILQSSKEVYARKVDYLEKLFEDLQKTAYNVKRKEKDNEDNADENSKSKRTRKRKAMVDGLDEYKLISPDDIPQLADGDEMNFNNVGLTYITQLRACLLKPEVSVHVELRDINGDLIGRKNDFRVNWPVNQDGMPCDLTLCYYEERKRNQSSDLICGDLSDRVDDSMCHNDMSATPPRDSPAQSMFGRSDLTSTPSVPHIVGFTDPLLNSTETGTIAFSETRRKTRGKKVPTEMTLDEFLTGKKRRSKNETSTKKRHNKRSEKKAKELEEQQKKAAEEISTVNCVAKGGVKEEGVVLSLEKLVEGSSMVTGASDVFSPPERKPEDSINKKNLPPTSPLHNVDHLQADVPEIKDDALRHNTTNHFYGDVEQLESSCQEDFEVRLQSPSESVMECAVDAGCSDNDSDVPCRGDAPQSSATSDFPEVHSTARTIVEDGQIYKTGILELDPMNQRIRAWEDRILPILEEQANRTKFRLPDYASRLLGELREGEVVPCSKLVASNSQYEVSRNFVALLHLCNTRNVDMQDGNVSLLSREYRLSAEDIESYE